MKKNQSRPSKAQIEALYGIVGTNKDMSWLAGVTSFEVQAKRVLQKWNKLGVHNNESFRLHRLPVDRFPFAMIESRASSEFYIFQTLPEKTDHPGWREIGLQVLSRGNRPSALIAKWNGTLNPLEELSYDEEENFPGLLTIIDCDFLPINGRDQRGLHAHYHLQPVLTQELMRWGKLWAESQGHFGGKGNARIAKAPQDETTKQRGRP